MSVSPQPTNSITPSINRCNLYVNFISIIQSINQPTNNQSINQSNHYICTICLFFLNLLISQSLISQSANQWIKQSVNQSCICCVHLFQVKPHLLRGLTHRPVLHVACGDRHSLFLLQGGQVATVGYVLMQYRKYSTCSELWTLSLAHVVPGPV